MRHTRPLGLLLLLMGATGALFTDQACAPAGVHDGLRDDNAAACTAPVDLRELQTCGRLRVLVHRSDPLEAPIGEDSDLPTRAALLREMGEELGLRIEVVRVDRWDDLVPALEQGRGDLIGSLMALTPELEARVAATVPLDVVREQVVARVGEITPTRPAELVGRSVVARPGSLGWEALSWLTERHPGIDLLELPANLEHAEALDLVAAGVLDLAVAPSLVVEAALARRPELTVAFNLTGEHKVAFAVRPTSPALRVAVDRLVARRVGGSALPGRHRDDLDGITARGVLRVLTQPDPLSAYVLDGRPVGFEYEVLERFAQSQGLRLELVVPPTRADLQTWLRDGRGDVVAASLDLPSGAHAMGAAPGVRFTRALSRSPMVPITQAGSLPIQGVADLAGLTVAAHRSGERWAWLEGLRADAGKRFELVPAPEDLSPDEIMAGVADGVWDATVVDARLARLVLRERGDLQVGAPLGETSQGWAVRSGNPQLLAALDAFLERGRDRPFYRAAWARHFRDTDRVAPWLRPGLSDPPPLSPWDEVVQRHAGEQGLDWRLMVSLMYQESRFRPESQGPRGARGLMQVLPSTADGLGLGSARGPEASILAGSLYLAKLRQALPPSIRGADRTWFALAAYNAGPGHVEDARVVADRLGLDPDRWFGQTELAMARMAEPAIYRGLRFGGCQGRHTMVYVREVQGRYHAYLQLARAVAPTDRWVADAESPRAAPR